MQFGLQAHFGGGEANLFRADLSHFEGRREALCNLIRFVAYGEEAWESDVEQADRVAMCNDRQAEIGMVFGAHVLAGEVNFGDAVGVGTSAAKGPALVSVKVR